jgi:hypothetical protein
MKYCSQIYYYLLDKSYKIITYFYIRKQEEVEETHTLHQQHKYCKMCDLDDFTMDVDQNFENK